LTDSDTTIFLAHSRNCAGQCEPLARHLSRVAERAAQFAAPFGGSEEARLIGLLHDLGKYGEKFQRRLRGEEHHIDHWSAGSWIALKKFKSISAALAIHGHHQGLYRADKDSLRELEPKRLALQHPLNLTLSESDTSLLLERLTADELLLPGSVAPLYGAPQNSASAMLDIRMLFSALVDADFLETEAHFGVASDGTAFCRPAGPALRPREAFAALQDHLEILRRKSDASEEVRKMRNDLLAACVQAADRSPGLFSLSAPTGSGKTAAMLAFALRHAIAHDFQRIVVVIPYLSIIDQTAKEYREIFGTRFGEHYVLEHHSLAGTRGTDEKDGKHDSEDDAARSARLLAENWDVPLIITTSVQFLESLFASKPSSCRKLHRLAKSVILFDEVQTLPSRLAIPTLASLSRLAERYGSTIVFATATQPAFSHLDASVSESGNRGWRPAEIASPRVNLFSRVRRTRVHWPASDKKTSWEELAAQLAQYSQALCVVNLKKHAIELLGLLKDKGTKNLFHLSTNMCPAHRKKVLSVVETLLKSARPCRLVSTQCIEAGVDLDFPVVYRAFGPLEAIAQAAGRCNRSAQRERGEVFVFLPDVPEGKVAYPSKTYQQAASVCAMLLKDRGVPGMNIEDPSLFKTYYRKLYDLAGSANPAKDLTEAIQRQDFGEVARAYMVIDQDAINILVPYDAATFQRLAADARQRGLSATWIRRARDHTVSTYRPVPNATIWNFLDPVPIARKEVSSEWFIYLKADHYDRDLMGLVPDQSPEVWLV